MYLPLRDLDVVKRYLNQAFENFRTAEGQWMLQPRRQGGESETAISDRLVLHLEAVMRPEVPNEVHVNPEYRNLGAGPKILDDMGEYAEIIAAAKRNLRYNRSIGIRPDIIIHQPGQFGPNYLVIELKKRSNRSSKQRRFDRLKLELLTASSREYRYEFGFELRAHDSSDTKKRKIEILSIWNNGEVIWPRVAQVN